MSRLRVSQVYNDAGITLMTLESIDLERHQTALGVHAYATLTPLALIVRGPNHRYALDMEGRPLMLDRLTRTFPELDRLIEQAGRKTATA